MCNFTPSRIGIITSRLSYSLDEAEALLGAAFGLVGRAVASQLRRPRLSYNVAIYHRSRPSEPVQHATTVAGAPEPV